MTKSQRIEIRVTAFEKETWAQAAGGPRRVSEWLRALANQAASKPGDDAIPPTPPPADPPAVSSQCPRWMYHRAGTFCGSCNQVN